MQLISDSDLNPLCQSCGLPIKDKDFYGKYKNGKINYDYCWFCFQNGEFTDKNASMKKFSKNVPLILSYMSDISERKAKQLIVMRLPRLKRWSKLSGYDSFVNDKNIKENIFLLKYGKI